MHMEEVVVYVDDLLQHSTNYACRICHEDENDSRNNLEAPCACSGTVKFAHRGYIQRWCDVKGNTTCEICQQSFEPGYISPPRKSKSIDTIVTIRGSLQVTRRDQLQRNPGLTQERTFENSNPECSPPIHHGANFCKSVALIFTVLLLVKHMFVKVTEESNEYPFLLVVLLLIRATGILVSMYIIFAIIMAIQRRINHRLDQIDEDISSSGEDEENESLRL